MLREATYYNTGEKKIWVHRTKKSSEKWLKWVHIFAVFGQYLSRVTSDLFWIAALRPWLEYASFEFKEAYFADKLNFDL